MYLEAIGHAVETAGDGKEALSKLTQTGYDGVVTDYQMPHMNGLSVLRHIRDKYPLIASVLMTAEKDNWIVEEALAAGAQACLFKPFHPHELGQALRWW